MTYIAIANFAFAGKTYFEGDDAPFDATLIDRDLIEALPVEDEEDEDGPVQSD
jgi:hypothetical protein